MAVGDIINSGPGAAVTWLFLQPAAGIEIIVQALCADGAAQQMGLTADGVSRAVRTSFAVTDGFNCKLGITNTNYLTYYASSTPAFSGIQIK